jgi:hypothetical protein
MEKHPRDKEGPGIKSAAPPLGAYLLSGSRIPLQLPVILFKRRQYIDLYIAANILVYSSVEQTLESFLPLTRFHRRLLNRLYRPRPLQILRGPKPTRSFSANPCAEINHEIIGLIRLGTADGYRGIDGLRWPSAGDFTGLAFNVPTSCRFVRVMHPAFLTCLT